MKKVISVSLIIAITFIMCACGNNKMKFTSEADMQGYVDGAWNAGNNYYIISFGKLYHYKDDIINDVFDDLKSDKKIPVEGMNPDDFYKNVFLKDDEIVKYITEYEIKYDYKNSCITSSDGSNVFYTFLKDGTSKLKDDVFFEIVAGEAEELNDGNFTKVSSSMAFLENKVKEEFETKKDEIIYMNKYGNLPDCTDVRYDKYNYLGRSFTISGTARLDDYYNWGYSSFEYGYFCIFIRPFGSGYSDSWYIYADRENYADLYNKLKIGSLDVTLVCNFSALGIDTGSDNMAILVDYKKSE